jgi:hypothetical protein
VLSADVQAFNEAAEEAHLREFQKRVEAKPLALEEIPDLESKLPQLQRTQTVLEIDAKTDQGWLFKNPYLMPLTVPTK